MKHSDYFKAYDFMRMASCSYNLRVCFFYSTKNVGKIIPMEIKYTKSLLNGISNTLMDYTSVVCLIRLITGHKMGPQGKWG